MSCQRYASVGLSLAPNNSIGECYLNFSLNTSCLPILLASICSGSFFANSNPHDSIILKLVLMLLQQAHFALIGYNKKLISLFIERPFGRLNRRFINKHLENLVCSRAIKIIAVPASRLFAERPTWWAKYKLSPLDRWVLEASNCDFRFGLTRIDRNRAHNVNHNLFSVFA